MMGKGSDWAVEVAVIRNGVSVIAGVTPDTLMVTENDPAEDTVGPTCKAGPTI